MALEHDDTQEIDLGQLGLYPGGGGALAGPGFQRGAERSPKRGRNGKTRVVKKFGGTCLATPEKIMAVAGQLVESRRRGEEVVAVVSARGGSTDELVEAAHQLTPKPPRRELDMLLATGEQASIALMAMAVQHLGQEAVSLTGPQCGIVTNGVHANARILCIHTERLEHELARGAVVIVAGFQGRSPEGELTTLGRGGSDTTATALAAALGADSCQIFTDVDCVYSADPRRIAGARRLAEISSDEMEELAWHGAQVMKAEAVEFATSNGVDFDILSPWSDAPGSKVRQGVPSPPPFEPRQRAVVGVAGRRDILRLSAPREALSEEQWEHLFSSVAPYDLVYGRLGSSGNSVDLLLSTREIPRLEALIDALGPVVASELELREELGSVSLVGFGIGSRPAALFDAMKVLADAGVDVIDSFTGRASVSFVVSASQVDEGVRVLHEVFVENDPPTDVMDAGKVHSGRR